MIWISKLPFALSLSKGMFMVRQAHRERNMEIILSMYLEYAEETIDTRTVENIKDTAMEFLLKENHQ